MVKWGHDKWYTNYYLTTKLQNYVLIKEKGKIKRHGQERALKRKIQYNG